ncbi:Cof-type HAD-IIB family hydrolase [Alkalibacterium kapii]|uniref:Haloacid dehalogenase n=1 Tax=Alkalibacterium kapii TaxID=426704 RepID=A0A511AWL7_9LACT|nr:Cof-type HAD-IIB family hydrolase [Alkalibacterium kapii]GEK91501.1 haloacid dehalogenase [Alkalibacterium kapii]
MENKKLFIFDIDGTVLNDDKEIPKETKEAIKELSESHDVAIATGRNRSMAKEVIKELGISHYIVCNGAAAYYKNENIYTNHLNKEDLERLLKTADNHNHQLVYETIDDLKRRNKIPNARMSDGMKFVGFDVPEYDKEFHKENALVQCLLFVSEEEMDIYADKFPHFRFVRWYKEGIDVLPVDGSKFLTIKILANHMGINLNNVIAFGDGMNDIEMIKQAGLGVAMGNARTEVKNVADMITDSNENNGISNALRELNYIK